MIVSVPAGAAFALYAVADCPFSVAQDYATEFLRDRTHALIRCRLGPWRPIVPGTAWVAARPDLTEFGAPHDELVLRWHPALPVLPTLEIVVRFRIAWLTTSIAMEVRYLRGGALFRRCSSAILGRVARVALADLLKRLTVYLERRERAYRRAHPPALGPVRVPPLVVPSKAEFLRAALDFAQDARRCSQHDLRQRRDDDHRSVGVMDHRFGRTTVRLRDARRVGDGAVEQPDPLREPERDREDAGVRRWFTRSPLVRTKAVHRSFLPRA